MAYSLKYKFVELYDGEGYPYYQHYEVLGYSNITIRDKVVIPSTYNDGVNGTFKVSSIGEGVFSGCTSLTSITIPNSVTSIGDRAFYNCYKLIEVKNLSTLGITAGSSSYGYVGYYAKRVYKEGASYLSTDKDGYLIYDDGTNKILVAYTGTETDLTLPSSITQINQYAFYNNSSLKSVTIPNSVTSIGNSVFKDCSGLTSITIPFVGETKDGTSNTYFGYIFGATSSSENSSSVPSSLRIVVITGGKRIASYAFSGCSKLTSIEIPNSVTSIGGLAFSGCSSLTQLILLPSTPPTLVSNAIPTTIQSIYVQQSSKAAYQEELNWAAFKTKIVSDNLYLSFMRFNQKNKEYIDRKINELKEYIDSKLL